MVTIQLFDENNYNESTISSKILNLVFFYSPNLQEIKYIIQITILTN